MRSLSMDCKDFLVIESFEQHEKGLMALPGTRLDSN